MEIINICMNIPNICSLVKTYLIMNSCGVLHTNQKQIRKSKCNPGIKYQDMRLKKSNRKERNVLKLSLSFSFSLGDLWRDMHEPTLEVGRVYKFIQI